MSDEQKQKEKGASKPKSHKVTLLKNIKYNTDRYKIGEEIEIDPKDSEAFLKAGIIEG